MLWEKQMNQELFPKIFGLGNWLNGVVIYEMGKTGWRTNYEEKTKGF